MGSFIASTLGSDAWNICSDKDLCCKGTHSHTYITEIMIQEKKTNIAANSWHDINHFTQDLILVFKHYVFYKKLTINCEKFHLGISLSLPVVWCTHLKLP